MQTRDQQADLTPFIDRLQLAALGRSTASRPAPVDATPPIQFCWGREPRAEETTA